MSEYTNFHCHVCSNFAKRTLLVFNKNYPPKRSLWFLLPKYSNYSFPVKMATLIYILEKRVEIK